MSKLPSISLHENYYRPAGVGKSELNFTCKLHNADGKDGFSVKVMHEIENEQLLLFEGPIEDGEPLNVTAVIKMRSGYNGRIWAVLSNEKGSRSTSLDPSAPASNIEDLDVLRKNIGHFIEARKDDSQKKTEPEESTYEFGRGRRDRPKVLVDDEEDDEDEKEIDVKVKIESGRWSFKLPRIEISSNFRKTAFGIAAGLTLTGAGGLSAFAYGYKQGLIDAEEVTDNAKAISMIPVALGPEHNNKVIGYLGAKPFIPEHIDNWNKKSEAHPFNDSDKKQADYIYSSIKPVYPEDFEEPVYADESKEGEPIKAGGPLYIARKALTFAEDRWAEDGYGVNPLGLLRGINPFEEGGGSSVADQLCGAVWEQTGKFPDLTTLRGYDPKNIQEKFRRKWHEVFCGIGLGMGGKMTVEEVFANYFTYVYMGGNNVYGARGYLETFWGITDLNDPRLTRGQQIILASLPKKRFPGWLTPKGKGYTFKPKDTYQAQLDRAWYRLENGKEAGIKVRALYILDGLAKEGIIEDPEDVAKEIDDAKINADYLYTHQPNIYGYINNMAMLELTKHLKVSGDKPDDWKLDHKAVVVGIEPKLQSSLSTIMTDELRILFKDSIRGTVFVVDQDGVFKGIFTGSKDGYDGITSSRRITGLDNQGSPVESPGSVGKLTVAAALSHWNYTPDSNDTLVRNEAAPHLKHSSHKFADISKKIFRRDGTLEESEKLVRSILECYGSWKGGVTETPIEAAVSGNWNIQVNLLPAFLHGILTGKSLPVPHFITGDIDYAGKVNPWIVEENNEGKKCAGLSYQNGNTRKWGNLPFQKRGTMEGMHIPSSVKTAVGKTGTANADIAGRSTNIEWAPFGVEFSDGSSYMTVTYIRMEKQDKHGGWDKDLSGNMGNNFLASMHAVPVSDKVLQEIDKMHDEDRLTSR